VAQLGARFHGMDNALFFPRLLIVDDLAAQKQPQTTAVNGSASTREPLAFKRSSSTVRIRSREFQAHRIPESPVFLPWLKSARGSVREILKNGFDIKEAVRVSADHVRM
jgi:hypothetical protein